MSIIKAILLGIIQGIAEFLPISSSGHLVVMRDILGISEIPMLFDVLMHVPTLLAIIIVFRKRIAAIFISLLNFFKKKTIDSDQENLILIKLIIIASLPTAIIGLGINKLMDTLQPDSELNIFQANPWIVGILFLITAGILISSKFFKGTKNYNKFGIKEGILTGMAQGIGVLPGISRSGITISSSVLAGLDREKAGEYSFLISIPAIIGASLIELKDFKAIHIHPLTLVIALITSFVVGLFSLILLMKLIKKGRLYLFSIYLIPIGIISLIYFLR